MDYYQQGQQPVIAQQQQQQPSRGDPNQIAAGPPMQQQPLNPQQHQSSHRSSYSQQQQQQQQQQQPQQLSHQQQQAYLDSTGYIAGQQQQPPPPHQRASQQNGHHSSSSHHHGGQAPLPPSMVTGHHSAGHTSSGRYGSGSHRAAMMHQHRSSAAAISDPMMTSTITDHLASASGPMTGSGSALNQLGAYNNAAGYYQRNMDAVFPQDSAAASYNPTSHHQSRYDSHFSRGQRSGHSSAAYGAANTTTGAYHLDRTGDLLANDPRSGYYQTSAPTSLHHSLGNLPSATSRLDSRYGALESGLHHSGQQERAYFDARSGSMPPNMGFADSGPVGLGSYNPLDDPLMAGQHLHSRGDIQFSQGGFPQASMQQGGRSSNVYVTELRARLHEAQNSYAQVKRELETATQKLGSSMHSIKSFWSPELKKERALRKEEATKYALINDQMKLMRVEVQKQALLIRQLEEELRLAHETRIRTTDPDIQQHIDALCMEKEALFKENCIFRETIRELEMRIETQKQTLAARDDSIKKMVEMMNNKGIATKIMEDERMEMDRIKTRNIELEARLRHYETIIEVKEKDIIKSKNKPSNAQLSSTNSLDIPKSPVPKARKINQQVTSTTGITKPFSKAERLKNRLATSKCPPPSKEKLNEMILRSNSSASSSSGVSSSRSSEQLASNEQKQLNDKEKAISEKNEETSKQENYYKFPTISNKLERQNFKLCECHECQTSGQQIYSLKSKINGNEDEFVAPPPTPPRAAPRKAVSFRSNVEHIGSPNLRPLKDSSKSISDSKLWPTLKSIMNQPKARDFEDSCDSLHATKDFSLVNNEQSMNDYLRPLDCSTPKMNSSDERVLQAEVHTQRPALRMTDYTCLCSADFNCAHNYTSTKSISNDLYGRRNFQLSKDCVECKNLSTYVNLSTSNEPSVEQQLGLLPNLSVASSNGTNGYEAQEYRRLLKSKQMDVYGNLDTCIYGSNSRKQPVAPANEEQMHYIAAARELEHSLANCEMCRQQLKANQSFKTANNGNMLDCNCIVADVSSKSYHTASSSLIDSSLREQNSRLQADPATVMMNASELSVLPVNNNNDQNSIGANMLTDLQQASGLDKRMSGFMDTSANAANIDSSLSSLFVYRHISDDNQEFDPDSLEMKPAPKVVGATTAPATNGWLKARPKSEYISLSSTTSSASQAKTAPMKLSKQTGTSAKLLSSKANGLMMQVGSDLTQSSLARRRQLNFQQQQANNNDTTHKKKTSSLANKLNSRSSPNVSLTPSQQLKSKSDAQHNRSSGSSTNVKTIYQCFKNHFLDITSSSSSKSSSVNNNNQPASKLNKQLSQSSASLPRNLSSSKSRTSKAAQMEELRNELAKRDQELLTMGAKMKALEDQGRDSQRHIRVLKDSLVAKEEHYNLLLADVEELKRNLDERNKLIEKKSFQQTMSSSNRMNPLKNQFAASYQELQEMQAMLENKDKKINDLQRKVVQLDSLLSERDSQLERTRLRLEHNPMTSSGHQDYGLLNHLEETLSDKEKQISLLRDQRDRAEHELNEERDSHERSIKEYKMKLNSLKFEMEKLQNRFSKSSQLDDLKYSEFDRYSSGDQANLIKRLELDKRSLQLECDRLKDRLESNRLGARSGAIGSLEHRTGSALGECSLVEFERLQETLESHKQELRRAQAECRMNEMERKRAQEEADKLSERYERSQGEMHKLKAKLENAISEREQLLEECDRQQQLINKSQTERDSALADINQLKLDNERIRESFNKNQLQLERTQMELKKCEDRLNETSEELRHLQNDRSSGQRELKTLEMNLQSNQIQLQRLQQDKELARGELDKLREKYDRVEVEMERYLREKELNGQQAQMYKERIEQQQQQLAKLTKERDQVSLEMLELRERLHKLQKMQDSSEHETRNEVRIFKEKYERLLAQFEKVQEDLAMKQKENQMVMEKLQKFQNEAVKLEAKLEQSEMDRERMVIEVEKLQQINSKAKEEYKKWQEESQQLQEMYTKTNTKLLKLTEVEEKLRIDYDKCQMDLEVLRERYEKLQLESRKLQSERDRLQVDHERIRFDNERIQQSQGSNQATKDDFIRVSSELERTLAKLDQYQREINKLQLEKERLILDSKSCFQQTEQQYQQQLLKFKADEEKLAMDLERSQMQLEKTQAKYEQMSCDQEKLVATRENLQRQLILLQQEVDNFRKQQSSSVEETKKLHDDEMQRILQELETIREKYTQQRKELLQLRELQQNHEIDKDILKRELESAEMRLEKLNQVDSKQKQDSERCMIEIEKLKDKIERKQQELARTQKERNQFAQEITLLHQQIQQLQVQYGQSQKAASGQQQQPQQQQPQQQSQPQSQPQQQQQQVKPDEINKLKQMLVKSETDLQKTMAENQRFQMEVERLKLQLDDAAEYIGKIESDNKTIQKQNQEIIQQLKQQQQQQQSGGQQQQQTSGAQQQELERNQQEMKKMQDVIKKSANEIQKMVEERNKLQELNKELQKSLQQTKVDFENTINQYEAELQRLQQENQQQGGAQQQQAQNDEFKIKFQKAADALRAYQKSTEDLKKEILKLNEINKNLSNQNQELMQNLKVAKESLQKSAEAKPGEVKQDSKDGNQQQQQLAQLSELCAKLEKDLSKSNEDTKQHQQLNQQLKQALDRSQADLVKYRNERDQFQAQLEKLMVELERKENEMANVQVQQDKSGQNLQSKQNELLAYQKQLEEREKALEAKKEELQNLSKQIQQQQQAPAAGSNNQQQLEQMVAKLQQQIKILEEEKGKLKGELERVRNELKQSQAELERLLKILSAGEEDKFNLTQQIEQLQNKIKSMQQQAPQQQQQQQQPPQAGRGPQPGEQRAPAPPPQQARGPPTQQRANPPPPPPQQQQQQQQKPANQGQRPTGAGGFISGFFQ